MSPRLKSYSRTAHTTVMFNVVHPGSGVYLFTHILFYDIQYLTYRLVVIDRFDVLFCSIYGVDTDAVAYDDYLCNNNDTNNDTPCCISGVENDCSRTARYGNNNISSSDTNVTIVMHFIYNSVVPVTALDSIPSSSRRSFVCLSSELAPMSSFSSDRSCLSSDFCRLLSDCSLVRLEHVPIALVASEQTISSLSSSYFSPVSKFLFTSSPGLCSYSSPSHTKSPSCIPISVPFIEPSFGPSIAPIARCFTRHIYSILFLQFNTESFVLHSYGHIHDHGVVLFSKIQSYYSHLSIYVKSPLLPIIQNMCPL